MTWVAGLVKKHACMRVLEDHVMDCLVVVSRSMFLPLTWAIDPNNRALGLFCGGEEAVLAQQDLPCCNAIPLGLLLSIARFAQLQFRTGIKYKNT
jgi:hypothetical protein